MSRRRNNEGAKPNAMDGPWDGRIALSGRTPGPHYGDSRRAVALKPSRAARGPGERVPLTNERQAVRRFLSWWLDHSANAGGRPLTRDGSAMHIRLQLNRAFGHRTTGAGK